MINSRIKLMMSSIAVLVMSAGCYYDNEAELYPAGSSACVTTNMSFANDVNKIFTDSGCFSCHSAAANFGNVNLSTHAEVLKYVNDKSLVGSLKHTSGFSAMPQGSPKIGNCSIEKIEAWIAQGSQNN